MNSKTIKTFVLIVALCLVCATPAIGQTPVISQTDLFGYNMSDKEIAAEKYPYLVTYYHSLSSTSVTHHFIVQDLQNNITKEFPMEANYPNGGSFETNYNYIIHDLRVDAYGVCYFCGVREESTDDLPPQPPAIDVVNARHGFVGKFDINEVMAGNGTYTVLILDQTKELTRIEPRGSYEQVFAVGTTSAGSSCIVGLDNQASSTGWYYNLVTPNNTNEVFTDLINSGSGPIFVSRFEGENYHIGLRHTKNGPLDDPLYFGMLQNCNVYDMQPSGSGMNDLFRSNSEPLLLTGNNGPVSMAHSCAGTGKGLALYRVTLANLGDARITAVQHVVTPLNIRLQDASTISNINGTRVHLLSRSATYPFAMGYLFTFNRANPTPPTAITLTNYNPSTVEWQWLGKCGDYLCIYGHRTDNRIFRILHPFHLITPESVGCLGNVADMVATNLTVPSPTIGGTVSRVNCVISTIIEKELIVSNVTLKNTCYDNSIR